MSTRPRYAELASRLLIRSTPEAVPPLAEDRANAVLAATKAMRRKAMRRRIVRGLSAAAAVAAGVAIYIDWRGFAKVAVRTEPTATITGETLMGEVVTVRGANERPVSAGDSMVAGDTLLTRSGSQAELRLSTGTKLVVEESAELGIVEQGARQIFALGSGALRAQVAKLRDGERFIVRTADAEIEVRGTAFRLARVAGGPACPGGWTTRLSVYEGLVVVRVAGLENRIAAGQDWKAECSAPPPPVDDAELPSDGKPKAPSPSRTGPESPIPSAGHGLQAMNDLFADAMDAKRRGDKQHALAALRRLEGQYPSSHLAESATVERMKILSSFDVPAAAVVARRYLERYPDGFARDLAEGIVAKAR